MPRRLEAELALVGIAAVWGLTFVMVQDAVEVLPVSTFLAYRFGSAALLVGLLFRRQLTALTREGLRLGIVMGLWLTGGYVFQTLGLQRTSAANAGFITGMFVVLTPVFGSLLGKTRAGRAAWGAAVVSAVGLFMLSGGGRGISLAGDVLVFLCACCFSFHILATASAAERHPTRPLLAVQLSVCGVLCFLAALTMGDLMLPRGRSVWVALAVTSVVASALGFFVQTFAQRHAPPARTALILASEPAFAGLFAYLLDDERLSATAWAGAGLILLAIIVSQRVSRERLVSLPEGSLAPSEIPPPETLRPAPPERDPPATPSGPPRAEVHSERAQADGGTR